MKETLPAYQRGEDLAERHPVLGKCKQTSPRRSGVACAGSFSSAAPWATGEWGGSSGAVT